jgi:hypothetical protein
MRKVISLALVLLAAGAVAAWASAGTVRHYAVHTSGSSIAEIADASSTWAEFSSKVPNLADAEARESRQANLARAMRAAASRQG